MTVAGIFSAISPSTPPRPLGSGQSCECGIRPKNAAVSQAPANQAGARFDILSMGRFRISRSAQASAGSKPITPARPKNCITRSAKTAPLNPRALSGVAPLALEKLGSDTFQVARAATASANPAMIAIPMAKRSCRWNRPASSELRPEVPDERVDEPVCMVTTCPNRVLALPGPSKPDPNRRPVNAALTMDVSTSSKVQDAARCHGPRIVLSAEESRKASGGLFAGPSGFRCLHVSRDRLPRHARPGRGPGVRPRR
jgi:hypothetical protein